MAKLAKSLYSHRIHSGEAFNLTANIVVLSVIFTFIGGFVSYVFYYIFDEYGPDDTPKRGMEWEKHSTLRKVADISLEITAIGLVSFWLTYFVNTNAPIFPVSHDLVSFIDTYTTGMIFMYTVFLFSNDLSSKLRHLYNENIGGHFDMIFPKYGSIWDMNLSYSKTNSKKEYE
jgi:hypothetical protein